jgi:hypothetical protein
MAVSWVKVFHQARAGGNTLVQTFTGTATNANDAILFFVQLKPSSGTLTTVTLAATGWTFTNIVTIFGDSATGYAAVFAAIAPNTSLATFTVTWSGGTATSSSFDEQLADEFTGNDRVGGTTTFDAHNSAFSDTTYANLSVTPANNNDGVWFALSDSATNAAAPYTKGCDDGNNDLTEWKILLGNSGVAQTSAWTGSTGAYLQAGVTIKPLAGHIQLEGGTGNIELEDLSGDIALE